MKEISEYKLQQLLDDKNGEKRFLMFEDGGKLDHGDTMGTWEDEGDHYKVVLFGDDTIYHVMKGGARSETKEQREMVTEQEATEKRTHYKEGTMQCKGTKKNGEQCTKTSKKGEEYCHQHMPKEGNRKALVLTTPFEAGAMDHPEEITDRMKELRLAMIPGWEANLREGVAKLDAETTDNNQEKKEKQRMLMPIDGDQARALRGKIDFRPIDQKVVELYGYRPGQIYSTNMVERNSGQAHDSSKPGYLFYASDYVGQIMRDKDNNLFVVYDRNKENVVIEPMVHIKEEEAPMATPATKEEAVMVYTIFICNFWQPKFGPKAEHGVYYWNSKHENVAMEWDDLVKLAQKRISQNKGNRVLVKGEGVRKVITEDGVNDLGNQEIELRQNKQNRSN